MRIFVNLLRALAIIGIGGLIGYYDFQSSGWIGVITSVTYFVLGILLVTTWKNPERKLSEQNFDAPSLSVQATDANAAAIPAGIDKEGDNMPRFDLETEKTSTHTT